MTWMRALQRQNKFLPRWLQFSKKKRFYQNNLKDAIIIFLKNIHILVLRINFLMILKLTVCWEDNIRVKANFSPELLDPYQFYNFPRLSVIWRTALGASWRLISSIHEQSAIRLLDDQLDFWYVKNFGRLSCSLSSSTVQFSTWLLSKKNVINCGWACFYMLWLKL